MSIFNVTVSYHRYHTLKLQINQEMIIQAEPDVKYDTGFFFWFFLSLFCFDLSVAFTTESSVKCHTFNRE